MKQVFVAVLAMFLVACNPQDSSTQKERKAQEEMAMRAVETVGMPAITKFSEKRTLKSILELRDKDVATYTYIVGMSNEMHLLCHSIGYGIPYSTQYTNPERKQYEVTLPQADPNGLFSPDSAEGTWVMCLNTETKQTSAVLVEPRIIVSPYPLK